MRDINRTRLATVICCVGIVVIGLSFESFVFSLSIAAALCIGSLSYGAAVYASRIKAAKLFLLNAGLLALIFALLANIVHFLRPVDCADCFFPYGLPFTLFTEGGYGGGGGLVWAGIFANAALVPAFATICTLLWNRVAKKLA